jgi:hypothetical protein
MPALVADVVGVGLERLLRATAQVVFMDDRIERHAGHCSEE